MEACLSESTVKGLLNSEVASDAPAIYWNGELHSTYADLRQQVIEHQRQLQSDKKQSILLYVGNFPIAVSALVASIESNSAVLLADATLSEALRQQLEHLYRPQWIGRFYADIAQWQRTSAEHYDINPDLSLLLSTSGSTGSPKYVKLSRESVVDNASAIATTLAIDSSDVAAAHLDFHYSYGLSVLTSHLHKGASLSLSDGKFTDRTFWNATRDAGVTHLPGVPLHYEIMARLGFKRLKIPAVKTMTQAGGRLAEAVRDQAYQYMSESNGQFFVMYGQTEAAPRMSTLQHSDYASHKHTVGHALPGGEFCIVDEHRNQIAINEQGEVMYRGSNVMMGYANDWRDLATPDSHGGELMTGDLGKLDEHGYLTITGRSSRFGKVYGWRVNLDEIEALVGKAVSIACVEIDGVLALVVESDSGSYWRDNEQAVRELLSEQYTLPATAYQFFVVKEGPVTSRGKTDYRRLAEVVAAQQVE